MPIESGSGGTDVWRSIPQESGAQPLDSAYNEQPWLGDAFGSYTGNPAALPVDTHEIVGMIAPRGAFIMENPHVDWLGAKSGSLAALGHPDYGSRLHELVGNEFTDAARLRARAFVLQAVAQERRVERVLALTVEKQEPSRPDSLRLGLVVKASGLDDPVALGLEVAG